MLSVLALKILKLELKPLIERECIPLALDLRVPFLKRIILSLERKIWTSIKLLRNIRSHTFIHNRYSSQFIYGKPGFAIMKPGFFLNYVKKFIMLMLVRIAKY